MTDLTDSSKMTNLNDFDWVKWLMNQSFKYSPWLTYHCKCKKIGKLKLQMLGLKIND